MYLSNKIEKVTFIDFDEFFEDVIHPDIDEGIRECRRPPRDTGCFSSN
jgi:hypothetical protein